MLNKVKPFLLPGALVTVLLTALGLWNRNHRQLSDALREAEASKLFLRQQIVTQEESKKELQGDLSKLLAENEMLAQAYEIAMKAAPDAKPTEIAELRTDPLPVYKAPRPARATTEAQAAVHDPPVQTPPELLASDCVLAGGDLASIDVKQVRLVTENGNTIIAGTAEVYREEPGPRVKFLAGQFRSTVSEVQGLTAPTPPRWGALALGACGAGGCGPGGGVLFPPATVFGLRFEPFAGVVLTPGAALALGGLGVRW